MTLCRFSCENPRSVWMDDSATLTIAMSRMVMNCTARMSASANHFFRFESTMKKTPGCSSLQVFVYLTNGHYRTRLAIRKLRLPISKQSGYTPSHGEDLRPVLPDRACSRSGRGALVAADRPRAHPRGPAALLRPPCPTRGLRDEHPCRPPQGAGAGWRRPPSPARSSGCIVGLRAHRVRPGLA